jgi:hypothetical protein
MLILHKNPDRLLRDAKKLKKHANKKLNIPMTAQESIDIIAQLFDWNGWNAMYVAMQKPNKNHTFWHDMRWREKVTHMEGRPLSVARGLTVYGAISDAKIISIASLLTDMLSPYQDVNGIVQAGFLGRFSDKLFTGKMKYSGFSVSRCREGVEVISSNTLLLSDHLRRSFLPEMSDPNCVVFCEHAYAIDFVRAFTNRGYKIIVTGENMDVSPKANIDVRPWVPDRYGPQESPFSLRSYLLQSLDEDIGMFYDLARALVRLATSQGFRHEHRIRIRVPTIADCALIWLGDEAGPDLQDAKWILSFVYGGAEHVTNDVLNAITKGDASRPAIERWSYAAMQLTELVQHVNELYMSSGSQAVSEFERQCVPTVYLHALDRSHKDNMHGSIMFKMILERLAEIYPLVKEDLWLIIPTKYWRRYLSPGNGRAAFDFKKYNSVGVNVMCYGEYVDLNGLFDTTVTINKKDDTFKDSRYDFMKKLSS